MRSLRLDLELEEKIQRAATATGESVSEFIRNAAEVRADSTLADSPNDIFFDVIGVIHGGGGNARHSGRAFSQILSNDRASR